jgi:hypothetical protein
MGGSELGREAGRTFAGFVPDRSTLRRRAEVAVCGQRFVELSEPVTVEMVCERDAFVVAFLEICKPTTAIVRGGVAGKAKS